MRFAAIYGGGAVLGYTPQDVRKMSIWQYMAAVDGYIKANSSGEENGLTESEKDQLADWLGI